MDSFDSHSPSVFIRHRYWEVLSTAPSVHTIEINLSLFCLFVFFKIILCQKVKESHSLIEAQHYNHFTHWRIFHIGVSRWISAIHSKSPQVSRTLLSILADLNNAVGEWSPLVLLFPSSPVPVLTLW